jgi:hypothetical protein
MVRANPADSPNFRGRNSPNSDRSERSERTEFHVRPLKGGAYGNSRSAFAVRFGCAVGRPNVTFAFGSELEERSFPFPAN